MTKDVLPVITRGIGAAMNAVNYITVTLENINNQLEGLVSRGLGIINNVQDLTTEYVQDFIQQAVTTINSKIDEFLDAIPEKLSEQFASI